jgi:hypothetical protein
MVIPFFVGLLSNPLRSNGFAEGCRLSLPPSAQDKSWSLPGEGKIPTTLLYNHPS